MVTFADKAAVSLPSDREVSMTRAFRAARARVYEAFTQPALIQRWLLGPPGWTMPVCEMDVRVGGTFVWRWRSEKDGAEFGFHGEFLEVEPNSRIRHTENYDPADVGGTMGEGNAAIVTVTYTEQDGRTIVTTLVDYGSKEGRDAALATGMTDGMEMSYKLLDTLLTEDSA
jgi:uncharacterized protein YndB with AHSA1/START domain